MKANYLESQPAKSFDEWIPDYLSTHGGVGSNRNLAQNIKKQKFILDFMEQYGPTDAHTEKIIEFFSGFF